MQANPVDPSLLRFVCCQVRSIVSSCLEFSVKFKVFGDPEYLYPFLCLILVYILLFLVIQWSVSLQISDKALST